MKFWTLISYSGRIASNVPLSPSHKRHEIFGHARMNGFYEHVAYNLVSLRYVNERMIHIWMPPWEKDHSGNCLSFFKKKQIKLSQKKTN